MYQVLHFLSEFFRQKHAYSEPRQKSKMERFVKIVHGFRRLTISVESSILDVGLSSEYASADYQFSQKAKQLNYSLIKLLLAPS